MKHKFKRNPYTDNVIDCAERADFKENMRKARRHESSRYEQRTSENREGVPVTMKIIVKGKQGLFKRTWVELRGYWQPILITTFILVGLLLAFCWAMNY